MLDQREFNFMNIHTFEAFSVPLLFSVLGMYIGKWAFSSAMLLGDALWIEVSRLAIMLFTSLFGVYLKSYPVVNAFFRNKFKKKGKKNGGNR